MSDDLRNSLAQAPSLALAMMVAGHCPGGIPGQATDVSPEIGQILAQAAQQELAKEGEVPSGVVEALTKAQERKAEVQVTGPGLDQA